MSNRQHFSGIKLKSKTFRLFFIAATLMFIYLHKGKEYIMISRQPVQGDTIVQYVLEVSQKQPGAVNPFYPYIERNRTISIYEEWDTLQNNK